MWHNKETIEYDCLYQCKNVHLRQYGILFLNKNYAHVIVTILNLMKNYFTKIKNQLFQYSILFFDDDHYHIYVNTEKIYILSVIQFRKAHFSVCYLKTEMRHF